MKNFFVVPLLVGALIILFQPLAFGEYYHYTQHTKLILNSIPLTAKQGDNLTFSGTLLTSDDKVPLANRTVYIQYDSPYEWTRTITSVTTDNNGNFSVIWTVSPKGTSSCTYNLFAKFNGEDNYYWSVSRQFGLYVTASSDKS